MTSNEKLTRAQQNSLHLYFTQVADALNAAGYSVEQVLTHYKMELQWTPQIVKELLWKTAQKRMFSKQSTTQLLKQNEIDDIYLAVSRFLGERLHIENPPFPSLETLEKNAEKRME